MAKQNKKRQITAKEQTAKYVALAAWAVPVTTLLELIKQIIKRLF